MKVPYKYFLADIKIRYNLDKSVHNSYVYIKIQKGIYGLKQAVVLAYTQVSNLLKKSGYQPIIRLLGMWKYHTRNTISCLCVDDFGIRYYNREDILHLENALQPQYTTKIDWRGKLSWFHTSIELYGRSYHS